MALIFSIGFWFAGKLISGQKLKATLEHGSNAIIVAKIINKKVYMGNSPVSGQFFYKNEFAISGRTYYGDSRNPSKQPGDTISVLYNKANPGINQAVDR